MLIALKMHKGEAPVDNASEANMDAEHDKVTSNIGDLRKRWYVHGVDQQLSRPVRSSIVTPN